MTRGIQKHFLRSPSRACHVYSYFLWYKAFSNIDRKVPRVCPKMPHLIYFIKAWSAVGDCCISWPYSLTFYYLVTDQIPTHKPYVFMVHMTGDIHTHLLRSPSRACSAIPHPIYFTNKLFIFLSLYLYNDIPNDEIRSITLTVMPISNGVGWETS